MMTLKIKTKDWYEVIDNTIDKYGKEKCEKILNELIKKMKIEIVGWFDANNWTNWKRFNDITNYDW